MSSDQEENIKDEGISVDVGASAKYEVRKNVTQDIPADVTRARSNAWLDLISPLTEWAGLKGDELSHKRALLRIEQEESLYRVGIQAQERLKQLNVTAKPVPTKALIPILEKASLENPESALIEIWGNLLASASSDYDVEVITFSEILAGISPREALIIQELVGDSKLEEWSDRSARTTAAPAFNIYDSPDKVKFAILNAIKNQDKSIFNSLLEHFPADYPILISSVQKGIATQRANKIDTYFENPFFMANASGFEILEKQGLIKRNGVSFSWTQAPDDGPSGLSWYELTELGFAFVFRVTK